MNLSGVGVVVPVHDEAERLGDCLAALDVAFARLPSSLRRAAVVVLDACSDESDSIADAWKRSGTDRYVLDRTFRNVGRARAAGMDLLVGKLIAGDPSRTWLATTDADSRVPASWLTDQVRLAGSGVEAVAGSIVVHDWSGHAEGIAERFRRFYEPPGSTDAHEHVHGANLGVRADAYLAAGGFEPLATGEDHALWRALRRAQRLQVSSRRLSVVTSGRLAARAPLGFSAFLAEMEPPLSAAS